MPRADYKLWDIKLWKWKQFYMVFLKMHNNALHAYCTVPLCHFHILCCLCHEWTVWLPSDFQRTLTELAMVRAQACQVTCKIGQLYQCINNQYNKHSLYSRQNKWSTMGMWCLHGVNCTIQVDTNVDSLRQTSRYIWRNTECVTASVSEHVWDTDAWW